MAKRRGKIDEKTLNEVPLVSGGNDFDYCVKLFLEDMELRNLAYHTRRWHKENLHYIKVTLGKLNLPTEPINIEEKHFKQCILYWKRDCSLSPTTINHRIRSIKQLFSFLNGEGIVCGSPTNGEKMKTPHMIIRPFEEDELRLLFNQPDKSTFVGFRDYTIMLVLLDTGVRLIELENMKLDDVNLSSNKILVFGKGAKEREVVFQSTTKQFLMRYIRLRNQLEHNYLWISEMGNRLNRKTLQDRLKLYGHKAQLTKVRVSPHTFRHTCAKMYITKGGDILSLQKILGHSSLEMVRHYVNLWGSDLQQMHKRYSPVEGLFEN
ncbi:MAG: tyrosine-type recombinase/integrase [Syntrophomonas sp.]